MTLINVNCFVVAIKRQIIKEMITAVPKAKCHQCSKKDKSENSIQSIENMVS